MRTFGDVHRDVGVAQQRGSILALVGAGDTDAGAHVDLDVVDVERLLERGCDVFGNQDGVLGMSESRKDDTELVPAQPCHGVLGPQSPRDARPELAQELIARLVSERVVDLLEAIEIEKQCSRDRSVAA